MNQTINRGPAGKAGLVGEIIRNARLAWRLLRDGRVSTATKLLLPGLALGYLLFPADLVPDFLPMLGQLDDIAIVALGVKLFIGMCPPGVVSQLRSQMDGRSGGGGPLPREDGVLDGEFRVIE